VKKRKRSREERARKRRKKKEEGSRGVGERRVVGLRESLQFSPGWDSSLAPRMEG